MMRLGRKFSWRYAICQAIFHAICWAIVVRNPLKSVFSVGGGFPVSVLAAR